MARYSFAQLEGLWTRAGGSKAAAPVMAAIGLAESAGDSNAHNPSGAAGLWQIHGLPFPGNPYDPMTNARMAVSKYRSQGLAAWATYTSGAYRKFLPGGVSANVPGRAGGGGVRIPVPGGSVGGGAGGLLGIPASVLGFFTSAATAIDWFLSPSHWVRIIAGAAGGAAVLAGAWMLSHAGGGEPA